MAHNSLFVINKYGCFKLLELVLFRHFERIAAKINDSGFQQLIIRRGDNIACMSVINSRYRDEDQISVEPLPSWLEAISIKEAAGQKFELELEVTGNPNPDQILFDAGLPVSDIRDLDLGWITAGTHDADWLLSQLREWVGDAETAMHILANASGSDYTHFSLNRIDEGGFQLVGSSNVDRYSGGFSDLKFLVDKPTDAFKSIHFSKSPVSGNYDVTICYYKKPKEQVLPLNEFSLTDLSTLIGPTMDLVNSDNLLDRAGAFLQCDALESGIVEIKGISPFSPGFVSSSFSVRTTVLLLDFLWKTQVRNVTIHKSADTRNFIIAGFTDAQLKYLKVALEHQGGLNAK